MRHQLGQVAVALNNRIGKLARVAGGEAHALNAGNFMDDAQQGGKVADFAVVHFAAIGVHVLPQQVDFFHALLRQIGDFGQHVVQRAGEFFAARIRHHAETAIFGAAFHDGDERAATFHAGGRQVVEFLDFGEGNIDLRQAGRFLVHNHFGQAVQRLRAEHHVHIRRTLDNRLALLRCHTAGHADNHIGIVFFQMLDATQVGKYFFLRFFAYGTGVEQDDVRAVRLVHLLDATVFFGQHCQHFFAVVFVHLAAEGADKDFFHGLLLSGSP